jgi:hypothetical protein
VKDAWDHPIYSRKIGLYHIAGLDLETFPKAYPGLDLVGKCFVAPRGAGQDCPKPLSDPVPSEYRVELTKYGQARSNETKLKIWEDMKRVVQELNLRDLQDKPTRTYWSSYYLWAHCLSIPGRHKNYFQ